MHNHKWDDDTEETYCTVCDMSKKLYLALKEINYLLLRSKWDKASNKIYDLLECT